MSITPHDIPPALTGEALEKAIHTAHEKRAPIAEGLLYEQTITMVSADPNCGKSTISTQMAIELAAGLPLFGIFDVPRPMKVLYSQCERPIIEWLERAEIISKVYPIVKENLFVTDSYQRLNMLNPEHIDLLIDCIKRDCPKGIDVIFFDPIYAMVTGGLSQDIPTSAFTHALSAVQMATHSSLWYNHHTSRPTYTNKGEIVNKEDPSYGSRWLTAHVTGHYHMTKTKEGVNLTQKKDNYNLSPAHIILHYDAETGLCTAPVIELPAIEKVRLFIKTQGMLKRTFSFNDIKDKTGLCNKTIRTVLLHSSIRGMLIEVSCIRNKKLYQMPDLQSG